MAQFSLCLFLLLIGPVPFGRPFQIDLNVEIDGTASGEDSDCDQPRSQRQMPAPELASQDCDNSTGSAEHLDAVVDVQVDQSVAECSHPRCTQNRLPTSPENNSPAANAQNNTSANALAATTPPPSPPPPSTGAPTEGTSSTSAQVPHIATCPPNGSWGQWSEPSACSGACGRCGNTTMTRPCLSEAHGCPCAGNATLVQACSDASNAFPCSFPADSCCQGRVGVQERKIVCVV